METKELSLALDQHLVLYNVLKNGFNLKVIGLYWQDGLTVHLPEKFSMVNLFRLNNFDSRKLTQKMIFLRLDDNQI